LSALDEVFEQKYGPLLTSVESANGSATAGDRRESFKYALGVGRWDVDGLENTVAFVGGALSMSSWLERARKLLANWPQVEATTDLVTPERLTACAMRKRIRLKTQIRLRPTIAEWKRNAGLQATCIRPQ